MPCASSATGSTCAGRGSAIRCRRPWPIIAAGIIFGGPMSANDQDDFIRRETDWTAVPLRENKPYLGICLGAQMFARQLGGKVFRHPQGPRRDRLLPDPAHRRGAFRRRAMAGMRLPMAPRRFRSAARRRAVGRRRHVRGAGDPLRLGLRAAISSRRDPRHDAQVDDAGPRPHGAPGAKPRDSHFADRAVYDFSARAWLSVFLEHWMAPA